MVEAVAVALIAIIAVVVALAAASVRVLREYERAVVFRLGRMINTKGPGLVLLVPAIDRMVRVSLRTVTLNVPPQDVITRDNVTARVDAVVYFRVVDPNCAVVQVESFLKATSQIAQTTLRSVLGKADLDTLLSEREELNEQLQKIIDEQTEPWGVKVTTVEIKDVGIPQAMQHAMARQAQAERERRAKVINAEGEFQAAARLTEAADVISQNPTALQLRYLQTLSEIGVNQNTTIAFPLPIDLIKPLLEATAQDGGEPKELPRGNGTTPLVGVARGIARAAAAISSAASQWTYSNTRASSCSPATGCQSPAAPPPPPSRRPSRRPTRSVIPASSRRRCRSAAAGRPAGSRSRRTGRRPRSTRRTSSGWTSGATRCTRCGSRPRPTSPPSTTRASSSTAPPSGRWSCSRPRAAWTSRRWPSATPTAIARLHVDPLLGFQDFHARRLAFEAGVDADVVRPIGALLNKLYDAFVAEEAMLVEVNPLIVTSDRNVAALDAKVTLDDNSLFRHADNASLRNVAAEDEQERMARERGLTFVKLDGNVGILGNGAGLVMSTLDVVAQAGGRPANFLDAGGGSRAEAITQAVEVILSNENVTAVLFNIFGGITRCDEVAKGLIEAFNQIKPTVPFVVRLDGTNDKEGRALLAEANLPNVHPEATMLGAAKKVVELAG